MAFNHGKAIEVSNLIKCYGDLLKVDPINFDVHQSVVLGFFGPNCAATMTVQRMVTALPDPTEGRIVMNDHDLAHDAYPVKMMMPMIAASQ